MSDSSDGPIAGPDKIKLRAVFVPDGEAPPSDMETEFHPLRFRATLDPATGQITCDDTGVGLPHTIAAEFIPDDADQSGEI